ncbi:DUF2779 domain-containing protein, partial [bacterium]|nr:DUF2779 domain-containing protein [bacterium]
QVSGVIGDIPSNVAEIFKSIKLKKCIDVDIGSHCLEPYECALKGQCWSFLPDNDVFHLYWLGKRKKFELLEEGIKSIGEIPDSYELSEKQIIQKDCIQNNCAYIDKDGIKDFLKTLQYPLYYLDFETFSPAIPLFDGMKPYQRISFQFSLHIVRSEGAQAEHHSFLAEGQGDPRLTFLSELKKVIGTQGSVVTYNAVFEKGVLNELESAFPENGVWIHNCVDRVKDLLDPFKSFCYYHPDQNGSASLKCVLPAVTGKGYEDMNISNGSDASRIFEQRLFKNVSGEDMGQVRKDLEDYCCLDTQAMIDIADKLKEVSE